MRDWQSQSHVRWYCKYHIVFVPKYRRRVIYGQLRRSIGRIIRELCQQQGVELVEGHAMPDHVHLCLSIPPNISVAISVGFLKGKAAIRSLIGSVWAVRRILPGCIFGLWGYCVSTGGLGRASYPGIYPQPRAGGEAPRGTATQGSLDPFIGGGGPSGPFIGRGAPSGAFIAPSAPSGGLHQTTRSAGGT